MERRRERRMSSSTLSRSHPRGWRAVLGMVLAAAGVLGVSAAPVTPVVDQPLPDAIVICVNLRPPFVMTEVCHVPCACQLPTTPDEKWSPAS